MLFCLMFSAGAASFRCVYVMSEGACWCCRRRGRYVDIADGVRHLLGDCPSPLSHAEKPNFHHSREPQWRSTQQLGVYQVLWQRPTWTDQGEIKPSPSTSVPQTLPSQPLPSCPSVPQTLPSQPLPFCPSVPQTLPSQPLLPCPSVPQTLPSQPLPSYIYYVISDIYFILKCDAIIHVLTCTNKLIK